MNQQLIVCFLLLACAQTAELAAQTAPIPKPHADTDNDAVIQLSPFEVKASATNGYVASQSTASGRLVQPLENIAQNITIINATQIEAIAPLVPHDALQYVTGLSGKDDERYTANFMLRGFTTAIRRNGEATNTSGGSWGLPEAIEQYEVVRGASAVLYGSSQPGGVINYVTKSPQFSPSGTLTARAFSLSHTGGGGVAADITGPIKTRLTADANGNPTLAYRLVLVKEDRDDYRGPDLDYYKREGVFGKITWIPLPGLRLQSEYEYVGVDQFNGSALLVPVAPAGTTARDRKLPDEYGIPVSWTFRDTNSTYRSIERFWQTSASYTHDFGAWGQWTARALFSLTDHYDIRIAGPSGTSQPRLVTAADIGKVVNYTETVTAADVASGRLWVPGRGKDWQLFDYPAPLNSQWDLTGEVTTGPIKHQVLLGTNLLLGQRADFGVGESYQQVRTFVGTPTGNFATWVDNVDHRAIAVNWNDLRTASNPAGTVTQSWGAPVRTVNDSYSYKFDVPFLTRKPDSYYLFDNLGFAGDRFIVGLGARHDTLYQTVNGSRQEFSDWTYRYSALFKIAPWVHVFALHNESFYQNSTNADAAAAIFNRIIPPEVGKDNEFGLRFFLMDKKVQLDATWFDIKSKNVLVPDPYAALNDPDPTHRFRFIDGVNSSGLDLDLTLNWGRNFQTIASYSYQDATAAPSLAQVQANPTLSSVPLTNTARNSVSLLTHWDPKFARLPGLRLTLGARYTSEKPGGNAGSLPAYFIPAYTIVDAGVGYVFNKHWSFDLKVKNLFDKYAYRDSPNSTIIVAERPRTGMASVKYKF